MREIQKLQRANVLGRAQKLVNIGPRYGRAFVVENAAILSCKLCKVSSQNRVFRPGPVNGLQQPIGGHVDQLAGELHAHAFASPGCLESRPVAPAIRGTFEDVEESHQFSG